MRATTRQIVRGAGALALSLVAALFAMIALSTYLDAPHRAAKDRAYLDCFLRARIQVEAATRAGRLPPAKIEVSPHPQIGARSCLPITLNPALIEVPDFAGKRPSQGFLLGFWRGEWFEYYASWSGETTLLPTRSDYFDAFWHAIAAHLLIAILLLLGAAFLVRPLFKLRATA
jgi:hypothetical protein